MEVEVPTLRVQQIIGQPAPARALSRRVALCVAGLAVATALVMTSVAGALRQAPPASGELTGARLVAERFYDGANQTLLTGDDASLSNQLAPDARFVNPAAGDSVSIDVVANGLIEIGLRTPGARLEVVSLTVHGQEAVALVRIAGTAGTLVAASGLDHNGAWVDRLTVRDGIVTGLTGGMAGLRSSNVWFSDFVPRVGIYSSIGLVAVTLPSGATLPLSAPGPLVVLVQEGKILVEPDMEPPAIDVISNNVLVATPMPGRSIALHRGDRFTMHSGASVSIRNDSPEGSSLQLAGLWSTSGLESGTAVKNHHSRFLTFLVDGPAGATWEGATGGQATMSMKQEWETGRGSKRLSVEQIALGAAAALIQRLQSSNQHQVSILVLQGTVVIDPTKGLTELDVRPAMLQGPAGAVVPQYAMRVQQVGALPAVLLVFRMDHQPAFPPH
jgi:hypothetical protein